MQNPTGSAPRLLDVIVVIVLLLSVLLAMWEHRDDPKPVFGVPVLYEERLDINRISIDRIADDHARLYLLDDHAGILRIFDLEGNYQNTISFYDYINGVFLLAVQDDRLYVQDPRRNVYIFTDGEFNRFIRRAEAQDIIKGIDFENNPSHYEVRFASVWRVSEEGDICVIDRPLLSLQHQTSISLPVTVGIIMLFGLIHIFKEKKKKTKG